METGFIEMDMEIRVDAKNWPFGDQASRGVEWYRQALRLLLYGVISLPMRRPVLTSMILIPNSSSKAIYDPSGDIATSVILRLNSSCFKGLLVLVSQMKTIGFEVPMTMTLSPPAEYLICLHATFPDPALIVFVWVQVWIFHMSKLSP